MERSEITAIVLAAGRSSRMGALKQRLPVGGTPMLRQSVSNLLGCPFSDILVVLGHEAESVKPLLDGFPVNILVNENYQEGISSSIKCGLAHLKPHCGSVLIALGDQPFIPPRLVNRLIDEYLSSGKGLAYPVHRGQRGHPVILDRKYEAEMRRLMGDAGCRGILETHPDDHIALEVEDESILLDIDDPADYRLLGRTGSEAAPLRPETPMTLTDALGVSAGGVVSLVGGGGKTSIMFGIAKELMEKGVPVITTTTTKIMEPAPGRTPHLHLCGGEGITPEFWSSLSLHGHVTLAGGRLPGGKLEGIGPDTVSALCDYGKPKPAIIVEADGSAQRPLKAPNAREPVLPRETSLLVAVLGVEVIGKPLDERWVFRPEIYSRMTGISPGETVSVESIAASLAHPQGLLRDRPEQARVAVFINKVETGELADLGRKLAERLLHARLPGLCKVILGRAKYPSQVVEILSP